MRCKEELDLKDPIGISYRKIKERADFSFDITDLAEALEDTIIDNEEARIGYSQIIELEDSHF